MNISNNHKKTLIITLLIIGCFHLFTIREGHNWAGDFSMYIKHAQNIVEGRPFGETGYIYNPHYPQLGPKSYPPIFPVLLSPIYFLFGQNLYLMKVFILLFFLASLYLFHLLIKDQISMGVQIILITIIGFSPFFWNFKDNVLSDIPFLFFCYFTIFLIHRHLDKKYNPLNQTIQAIFIGILIYICFGTKTIGFTLFPAYALVVWVREKRISRDLLISFSTAIVLIVIQSVLLHSDSDYLDQFTPFYPSYILKNILLYFDSMSQFFKPGYNFLLPVQWALFFIILLFAFLGYLHRCKKITILEAFIPFYLAVVILWPTPQGFRFLIPVLPLFLFYSVIGGNYIRHRFHMKDNNSKTISYAFGILTGVTFLLFISFYSKSDFFSIPDGVHTEDSMKAFKFIEDELHEDCTLISTKPRVFMLYTDRKSSSYFFSEDNKKLWHYFSSINASHLIQLKNDPSWIETFIADHRRHLDTIFSNDGINIFAITSFPSSEPVLKPM